MPITPPDLSILKPANPLNPSKAAPPAYTEVFGNTMVELMERDEKIVALTAAMPDGTGVDKILEKFPRTRF